MKLNWTIEEDTASISLFDDCIFIAITKAGSKWMVGLTLYGRENARRYNTREQAIEDVEEWLFNCIDDIIKEALDNRLKREDDWRKNA